MKTLHKLKNKESLFTDFYVFDTETQGLRAKPDAFVFGVVYGWNFTKVLYSVEDFKKEFLDKRYKNKKVFAHNAEYDLSVIYENIYLMDKNAIFNNKFICATNGNCLFGDSLNIYPTSVKKIGELLSRKKLNIDNKLKTGKVTKVTKQMIKYCIRDCDIIYEALHNIFSEVGNIKITIAGLALDYYRRKYQPYHIDYNNKLIDHFFDSYYGGRNEVFQIGTLKAFCYDINSMYPDAMVNVIFPNPKLIQKRSFISVNFFNHYLDNFEGCAKITIHHKDFYFGFLPYRMKGKLLFPVGTFTGVYNFNEIRFALKAGIIEIKKVHYILFAPRMKSPFNEYAQSLYDKRKNEKNALRREIYKLLMNSLYGKFAQKIKTEQIYCENIIKEFPKIQEYQLNKLFIRLIPFNLERKDCFIEIKSKRGFLYHSIPLFSSYITSHARIKLLSFLIEYKNYIPVYCDTDSIFFLNEPPIKNSNELGEWKKEDKIITEIRGLKNYTYISEGIKKDKIKGIPKTAEKIGEIYKYSTLVKTKESMRRNREGGVLIQREKILKLTYDKRTVNKKGLTKPLKINNK